MYRYKKLKMNIHWNVHLPLHIATVVFTLMVTLASMKMVKVFIAVITRDLWIIQARLCLFIFIRRCFWDLRVQFSFLSSNYWIRRLPIVKAIPKYIVYILHVQFQNFLYKHQTMLIWKKLKVKAMSGSVSITSWRIEIASLVALFSRSNEKT